MRIYISDNNTNNVEHNDNKSLDANLMIIPVGDEVTFFSKTFISTPLFVTNGRGIFSEVSEEQMSHLYQINSFENGFIFITIMGSDS